MFIKRVQVDDELAPYIFKAATYSDQNGNHPETKRYLSPNDVLDGKWEINIDDEELYKRIHGQIYMFKLNHEGILIIE